MYLPECFECRYGRVQDGKSHCSREACYSYLSRYIERKALADYLQRNAVDQPPDKVANSEAARALA